jgi:hypothetical protein
VHLFPNHPAPQSFHAHGGVQEQFSEAVRTGPVKLEAATLTTACRKVSKGHGGPVLPCLVQWWRWMSSNGEDSMCTDGPKLYNWGQGKPWPISLAWAQSFGAKFSPHRPPCGM